MLIRFERIRAIIFDLDGTLVDSYDAIAESLNHALAAAGLPALDLPRIKTMVGMGLETLVARAMGENRVEEGVKRFRERYAEICEARTRLLPGVAETLRELRSRGYLMAVATNKPSYFARRILSSLNVADRFTTILGPDVVENKKPHPEMVIRAMASMGSDAGDTICVGDMEVDIQMARSAGIGAIVVPTGSRSLEELERQSPDLLLGSFGELLQHLGGAGTPRGGSA